MLIQRFISLTFVVASIAAGYICIRLITQDALPNDWWVVLAVCAVIIAGCTILLGMGGFALSFIAEPAGDGRFQYKEDDLTEILYPHFKRGYNESYCRASVGIAGRILSMLAKVTLVVVVCILTYQSIMRDPMLWLYVAGGILGVTAVIVLAIVSKVFRIFALCFAAGSAVLGLLWLLNAPDWNTTGTVLVESTMTWLPWLAVLGVVAVTLCFVRLFMQSRTYQKICPISRN